MPADPRALAQLLRLGSAPREDALLQAEMQQAAELARPRGRVYGTAGGAIMGGLAQGVRGMVGGFSGDAAQKKAEAQERARVDARQQWLSAALRGQPPPAGAVPLEQSPQEQAAGMAAALRGEPAQAPAAPDALTKLDPYQPGPLLGGGAAPSGTPAAPLAPLAGQGGKPGDVLRAKVSGPAGAAPGPGATLPGAADVPGTPGISEVPRPMESAPVAAPEAPAAEPEMSLEQRAEIAIGSGDPGMMAWGKTVLEQANLRAEREAKRQEGEAKIKGDVDAAAAKQKVEADKFGHEQRDKMMAIPAIRTAMDSRIALDQIQKAASQKSAMGDIAMVYGVITTFDPKSGVKEGEIGLTAEAQGFVNKLESTFQRLKDGARLTDTVRQDILETAKNMYLARSAPAIKLASEYDGYLARAGLNPREYLPDLGFSSTPKTPKTGPDTLTDDSGRTVKRLPNGKYRLEE